MGQTAEPRKQGLYDPRYEHDACGVGFVVDLKGRRSHALVEQAVQVLLNLEHRGACGAEKNTGDGAGILLQTPHAFLAAECERLNIELPRAGRYGVGMVFLPTDAESRAQCEQAFEKFVREEGQSVLGWRTVPTDATSLGPSAQAAAPFVRQIFIGRSDELADELAFERKLYVIRRRVEKAIKRADVDRAGTFYIPSLSQKTIIYKGMLVPGQLPVFYPDLRAPSLTSALALVHSRFSTNTFPNWARAHPYRYVAHNGEINTLRGNINWMHARETRFQSQLFGADIHKILPVIDTDGSDSAMFDNTLELLTLAGRSLPHALMMMIPEPWSGDPLMSAERRAFYEYHSCLMEPWDGPASIVFTDGVAVGAVLDRNGLRPARYYVTKDGLVVMASEVGVLDIPPGEIVSKGRLQPGRMFLVDTAQGRIVGDGELKQRIAAEHPYGQWLKENMIRLAELPGPTLVHKPEPAALRLRQRAFGYTTEEIKLLLAPMATEASEAIGSMGTDTPLAVLSGHAQLLYNYFKQLFAQVTNPPVDAIREELIMSTETVIGPEANMLEPTPECARQITLASPIITNEDLAKLRLLDASAGALGQSGFKSRTLQMLFAVAEGGRGLERALDDLCRQASAAIVDGYDFIILSDRELTSGHAPIPALLAVACVHHHLIREGTRTQIGFVVESGEPREVHHFALLLGYGAAAINPYLAFETLHELTKQDLLSNVAYEQAIKNYIKAINERRREGHLEDGHLDDPELLRRANL